MATRSRPGHVFARSIAEDLAAFVEIFRWHIPKTIPLNDQIWRGVDIFAGEDLFASVDCGSCTRPRLWIVEFHKTSNNFCANALVVRLGKNTSRIAPGDVEINITFTLATVKCHCARPVDSVGRDCGSDPTLQRQ